MAKRRKAKKTLMGEKRRAEKPLEEQIFFLEAWLDNALRATAMQMKPKDMKFEIEFLGISASDEAIEAALQKYREAGWDVAEFIPGTRIPEKGPRFIFEETKE